MRPGVQGVGDHVFAAERGVLSGARGQIVFVLDRGDAGVGVILTRFDGVVDVRAVRGVVPAGAGCVGVRALVACSGVVVSSGGAISIA